MCSCESSLRFICALSSKLPEHVSRTKVPRYRTRGLQSPPVVRPDFSPASRRSSANATPTFSCESPCILHRAFAPNKKPLIHLGREVVKPSWYHPHSSQCANDGRTPRGRQLLSEHGSVQIDA